MLRKFILILIVLAFLVISLGNVLAQDGSQPVYLRNTETFLLHSEYVDADYQISVALPFGYADSGENYAVLYLLDPHFFMGTVTEQTRLLRASTELPPLIIVGIGYPADSEQSIAELRGRDYIPAVNFSNPGSEQATAFLNFITEELIPQIDTQYRTNPNDRAISGYSFGGIFTLFAFAKASDTFQRYLVISPNLPWTLAELQTWQAQLTPQNRELDAQIFISVGELEGSTPTLQKYEDLLDDYPNLEVTTIEIRSATHYSAYGMALVWGLKTVYCNGDMRYTCN